MAKTKLEKKNTKNGKQCKAGTQAPAPLLGTETYNHTQADLPLRPEIGTQAQFKKKKPPVTYSYDSSLSPVMEWDGQNAARERGEALIREIMKAGNLEEAKAAAAKLKALSKPFLNWTGKAERLSFDVPTLPLFVHERLSTQAIIQTLTGHKKDKQISLFDLFNDPQHSVADQVLRAYEHGDGATRDKWANRMILGDSLVAMNSLLHYENMGGQVQMIYMDPPYGIKFGSNFQPFVRKRNISHGDDEDMTREPEMVKAYRDIWEVGVHSYLTYLRDQFTLARDLLTPSGSMFVQISDENLHHVREVMDEVFGPENFLVTLVVKKKSVATTTDPVNDYVVWFAKDHERVKIQRLWQAKDPLSEAKRYRLVRFPDGSQKRLTDCSDKELQQPNLEFVNDDYPLVSQDESPTRSVPYLFRDGTRAVSGPGRHWTYDPDVGMRRLEDAGRLRAAENTARGIIFFSDFGYENLSNIWEFHGERDPVYVVQTNRGILQRCVLMTTEPGDLVLDPTCGSGTTAYVAEQWGRRWVTADVSRVPLALARQRLLTATYPWYELKDDARGPAGGFVYKRRQNNKGEEVGGIVPHVTLKSVANNEPPDEDVLVDRPEEATKITRVCGPFVVEGSIPVATDLVGTGDGPQVGGESVGSGESGAFADRMLEVLRKSPVLRLGGNKSVTLKNVRPPTKSLSLSAEAMQVNGQEKPVAFVFGPENGPISEGVVRAAHDEASMQSRGYSHLFVIGFAIQPNARQYIEHADKLGVAATYVQATPDLLMGDLLKNMRSSQIFSVCGLPEVAVKAAPEVEGEKQYQVELIGLDVFDPVTMEVDHRKGDDVPAWFLDTDYNGLCFHVCQAFFPRTSAWDNLKKALKGQYTEGVWDHLAGSTSAPFAVGEHKQVAVKVIDDRGNELMVVKNLKEAR